jgi:hypothetical protein
MATLTEKENYLRTLRGECPEWVPRYSFGRFPGMPDTGPIPHQMFEPTPLAIHRVNGGGPDVWGVNYIPTYETGNALLPQTSDFILPLEKLSQWRDIIKAPDFSGVDWETVARKQIEESKVDRTETAVSLNLHFGYFQTLMSFMGFSDGLLAFYEEPDEVKDLLEFLSDFYMDIADKVMDLYNPDILMLMDDTAAWNNPFISADMYREFLLPHHEKYAKRGRERGLLMMMHNCGKSESFMDMLVGIGINSWDPAQTCNDLEGIKKNYNNKLVITGGWDARGRLLDPDITEEELRQSVRDTMDTLAVDGGYCWLGEFLSPIGDEKAAWKNGILSDEAKKYGHSFYGN